MLRLIATNLVRRPARTILSALGIALGVGAVVALISLADGISRSAGELIHLGQADFALFQSGLSDITASSLPQSLVPRVAAEPGVRAATPVQLVTQAVPGGRQLLVFGAPMDAYLARRLVLVAGRRARGSEALVGEVAARQLGVGPGSALEVRSESFRVAGVFHSGLSFEDAGVILPLAVAQRLVGRSDSVSLVAVSIEPGYTEDEVADGLERRFPGVVGISDPGAAARADTNGLVLRKSAVAIAALALAIGVVSVTNTMLMAVVERRRELGVLAAIGWRPWRSARLILGESLAIGLAGTALGTGLGVLGANLAVRALGAAEIVAPHVTAWGLARGVLVGVAVGMLGGLYPALRTARLDPVVALARE